MDKLMARGMLKAWEEIGVKIQKWTDDNIVFITVPQMAKTKLFEPEMTGEQLAKRIQKIVDDLFGKGTITFKYKVED